MAPLSSYAQKLLPVLQRLVIQFTCILVVLTNNILELLFALEHVFVLFRVDKEQILI